jgi:phosphoglycolate phosphatase
MRPKAILFDWDNTLVDSWTAIHDAQNHTLIAFGLEPWTIEETRARVRGSMRDAYPQLFGSRWLEAGEVFYDRFAAKHMETLEPLPGAKILLKELRVAGIYLAVVSNKKGSYLRKEAVHLGWHSYFDRIIGAFDAPQDKPAVDPVGMALDGSGISCGEDVWFVGDADIDLECATNAGCIPVLVREMAPQPGEFDGYRPALYVDSCLTLLKVVQNL